MLNENVDGWMGSPAYHGIKDTKIESESERGRQKEKEHLKINLKAYKQNYTHINTDDVK